MGWGWECGCGCDESEMLDLDAGAVATRHRDSGSWGRKVGERVMFEDDPRCADVAASWDGDIGIAVAEVVVEHETSAWGVA